MVAVCARRVAWIDSAKPPASVKAGGSGVMESIVSAVLCIDNNATLIFESSDSARRASLIVPLVLPLPPCLCASRLSLEVFSVVLHTMS